MASEETREAAGGYGDALAVGEFRALFGAYTVSMLGDIVAAVALTVLVFERTASPFLSGLTFTLAFVPYLFPGSGGRPEPGSASEAALL